MINRKSKIIGAIVFGVAVITALIMYLHGQNVEILNPKGPIARQERNLIYFALALSLVVIIPVFTMTIAFAYKYRESNAKASYRPEWDSNALAETVWWGIPALLILILSVVAWNGSHTLDPYRPLVSNNPAITIQVVALDWKWLFIYPQQNIATVNYVEFPKQTPINFELTSDAPMNSFWIPQLAGQVYAMPGMSTELHMMADGSGNYRGSSANISGAGFANMDFIAHSTTQEDFQKWVQKVYVSNHLLNNSTFKTLLSPTINNPVSYYSVDQENLYTNAVQRYSPTSNQNDSMPGMKMSGGMSGMSM
jgi:cytochrome o ubiquinol oxidase subunit 2